MEHIFSRAEKFPKGLLLHIIVRKEDIKKGRINVIDPRAFLQCALLNLDNNQTFKAHRHNWNLDEPASRRIAQESWVVIEGKVKVFYYDLDNKLIKTDILRPGDASFTLEGGHNYQAIKENTLVYEFKTGPYISQEVDKTFIK